MGTRTSGWIRIATRARGPSTLSSATSAPGEQNDPEASIRIGGMALILSTICPTASHNVPAVVLAGEADLVENEGVLHRGLATRIRGAGDRDVACRRPPVTAASARGAGWPNSGCAVSRSLRNQIIL